MNMIADHDGTGQVDASPSASGHILARAGQFIYHSKIFLAGPGHVTNLAAF